MKVSKVAAATARRLFGMCQTDGEMDDSKMRTVVSKLAEEKPRDYRAVLAALHRLVRLETARRTVLVESATELSAAEKTKISQSLSADYGQNLQFEYSINQDLLGGLRIKVGDDLLDGSVSGRIDRLSNAF